MRKNFAMKKIILLSLGSICLMILFSLFFFRNEIIIWGDSGGPRITIMICLRLPQESFFIFLPSSEENANLNMISFSVPCDKFDSCLGDKIRIDIFEENNKCIWSQEIIISESHRISKLKYTFRILEFSPERNMYFPQSSPWASYMKEDIALLSLNFQNNHNKEIKNNTIPFAPNTKFLIKTTTDCANLSLSTQSYGNRKGIIKDMQSWIFFGKNPFVDFEKR